VTVTFKAAFVAVRTKRSNTQGERQMMRKLLLATVAAATVLSAASAGDPEPAVRETNVLNGQVQLGDTYAHMRLHVESAPTAAAQAAAVGNALNATSAGGILTTRSTQALHGNVGAGAVLEGGNISDTAIANGISVGNSANVVACCGTNRADVRQTAAGGGTVYGRTSVRLRGLNGAVGSASAATVNSANVSSQNAFNDSFVSQESDYSARSTTNVSVDIARGPVIATSTTSVNNITSTNVDATLDSLDFSQKSNGEQAIATTDVYVFNGKDVVASSTANANSVVAHTTNGFAGVVGYQENSTYVQSETYATLDDFSGVAASSSYAVGNSVVGGAAGSSALIDVIQDNRAGGDVVSIASLNASSSSGGVGSVNAVAIGNAVSGYACNNCGNLTGTVNQTNSANTFALGTASVNSVGGVVGTATAVGNSATFQSIRPGH
jgi:hypothetical protein